MQLKVVKSDGSIEQYLHTKVIGTISSALAEANMADITIAEELADAVTYFLYHSKKRRSITASEIFSMVEVVLTSTGHEDAAIVLSEYHYERRLKRSRIEVVSVDTEQLPDAETFCVMRESKHRARWNKSRIVADLVAEYDISQQTARAIASMVEQKIFSMGVTLVSTTLIKHLVWADSAIVLRAEKQLQTV
ncbi:MAG: hypothetical protein KAS75_01845 [Planctomycetes bacterium]|nr:hypothetical protein [Planctomycetota bacterium]